MLSGQGEGWTDGRMGRTEVTGHLLRWGISSKKPFSNHSSSFLFSHGCSGVGDWCRGAWSMPKGLTALLPELLLPACLYTRDSLLPALLLSLVPGVQPLMLAPASLIPCPSSQEILHMCVYIHTHTHSQWVNACCGRPVGTYIITQSSWQQLRPCMGRCI